MPAHCQLSGNLLTLAVVGATSNAEIALALTDGISSAETGARLGLLWDARRAVTLLIAEDFAFRLDFVAALANRKVLVRAALLLHLANIAEVENWQPEHLAAVGRS